MDGRFPLPVDATDEALIARVVQRDTVAFGLLYDRYARPIYALAAHTLGRDDAEEVVQDVFLRVWNKADQFDRARSPFVAWLMAIARHRVLDLLQARSLQHHLIVADEVERLLAEAADDQIDVEEEAWLHERGAALVAALRSLPPEQRRVLVLAYYAGLSQSTMAEQLGWPLGTVKKRVRLGLQKLRSYLIGRGLAAEPHSNPTRPGTG